MTGCSLIAQINADWRVVLVHDQNAWRRPAWMIQRRMDDGAWHDQAAVRASGMLREIVGARVGHIDADTAKILEALPERVDVRLRPSAIATAPK
jgi:hypothetical protein